MGAAHPSMVGRWEGVAQLADDTVPVVLDTAGARITLQVADTVTDVVMPHVRPDAVLGHAMVVVPHPLVPAGSICHLDALPVQLVNGRPIVPPPGERADLIVGCLVSAQYPGGDRRRQGDAVSAALRLERIG